MISKYLFLGPSQRKNEVEIFTLPSPGDSCPASRRVFGIAVCGIRAAWLQPGGKKAGGRQRRAMSALNLKAAAKAVAVMGLATKKDPECVRVVVRWVAVPACAPTVLVAQAGWRRRLPDRVRGRRGAASCSDAGSGRPRACIVLARLALACRAPCCCWCGDVCTRERGPPHRHGTRAQRPRARDSAHGQPAPARLRRSNPLRRGGSPLEQGGVDLLPGSLAPGERLSRVRALWCGVGGGAAVWT